MSDTYSSIDSSAMIDSEQQADVKLHTQTGVNILSMDTKHAYTFVILLMIFNVSFCYN